MAERLVIISDIWGAKKGLWITSYLGYLQQHFDIVFYDCQELANIDLVVGSEENLHKAFVNGGIDTAVAHLLKREKNVPPSHYLAFSTGGTIAWKASLKGLNMKSLYTVSSTRVRLEAEKPSCELRMINGANDEFKPSNEWVENMEVNMEIVPNFGHHLYSDEKIISKICIDLLEKVIEKQLQD